MLPTKLAIAFALSAALPLSAAALTPKQLAGPPTDFASLRLQPEAAAAVQSNSALLRVETGQRVGDRFVWSERLPALAAGTRIVIFSGGDPWSVALDDGRGSGAALSREADPAVLSLGEMRVEGVGYTVTGSASVDGALEITGPAISRGGFVLVEGNGETELTSYPLDRRFRANDVISFAASLSAIASADRVDIGLESGRIDEATLVVTRPDGSIERVDMDTPIRANLNLPAGTRVGQFLADRPGTWLVSVEVRGVGADGAAFLRTAEHVVPVVIDTVELGRTAIAVDGSREPGAFHLLVPLQGVTDGDHYRAYAEVWGRGSDGKDAAVAWLGGIVEPKDGIVALRLDQRWLALANVDGPYVLRNLRIEDADFQVPLAEATDLPIDLPVLGVRSKAGEIVIDDTMTMGPRPAELDATRATGARLLLVHGYCSGGVWPTANFSNASTFADFNQNRSNDQFARLISSFGEQWNSFGIVAHSQGGMAALHLYNYYWSGLDRATGARLIQSVGTPYRGTNLAGILAALGSWFGVGCGTQNDLTYSGAQAWLAGISSASRAKVSYYTTGFRSTNWWTNDFCQFATDLVLRDPEDGTTEQVNGQLSGGINRGHTTGQCHTDNMRDPAQFRDAARNAIMNSNAAR